MCATGFGAPAGIGLIAGGASSLLSSTLGAAGFDPKFVSMVNAGVDVVVGASLLLTPFAPVGAGMVGSGFGALAGGAISEKLGGSYELGANIGSILGGAAGGAVYGKVSEMKKISAMKSPNNICEPNCFIAGTLIETTEGKKSIEEIQIGSMVLAENPETGEISFKKVVHTFENESDELVHVFVNGEEIITTPSHPFYVPKLGWTSAIKLRAGDVLVLSNGEYVVVEKVQHEILESPIKVYNFEVEDFHTYFVGESGILVHNKCCYTNQELIDAAEEINKAQYNGHPFASKMNPISVTATSDGQIIVSKNRGIPGKLSRAQAKAIFGDDVIIVSGRGANFDNTRWGYVTERPWHAEARAVQYMNANGISSVGARQATTLKSCPHCFKLQQKFFINNITG